MSNTEHVDINKNCFDVIRIVCTFTVFLGHFITHFDVDSSILHEIAYFVRGVPVFFFLSGFFIARSLDRYNTKTYLIKRVVRIFPELWVCVLLNLFIILITFSGTHTFKDIIIYLVTQLTMFQFYTGGWLRSYGVGVPNGALWTITVDIQFYLLAILIVLLLRKKGKTIWISMIVLFIAIDVFLLNIETLLPDLIWKVVQCIIVPFMWIFFAGMALYYWRDAMIPFFIKMKWIIVAVYVIWQLFAPSWLVSVFSGVRYNIITTLLLLCTVTAIGFSFNKRLRNDFSYSFYLYHMVIINIVYNCITDHFDTWLGFVTTFVAVMIATALCAYASHMLIGVKATSKLEAYIMDRVQ